MRVYVELFYNNVEGLLASAFPVCKRILDETVWHGLVRRFLGGHASETPYFLEISQEFLTFLADWAPQATDLPPFLLELCHYEWVELALSVAEEDLAGLDLDPDGDLRTGVPVVSPLIWKLAYHYPVHRIGPGYQPDQPDPEAMGPTQLVVFRRRDDDIGFMEVNALTLGLLDELEVGSTGEEALVRLAPRVPALDPDRVLVEGLATLERLRKSEIILGTRWNT